MMITALRILAAADRPLRAPTEDEISDWWWFMPGYCITPTATYYGLSPSYLR